MRVVALAEQNPPAADAAPPFVKGGLARRRWPWVFNLRPVSPQSQRRRFQYHRAERRQIQRDGEGEAVAGDLLGHD